MTSRTILIIDDDRELCDLVGELLRAEGSTSNPTTQARAPSISAASGGHALVILDVMLPEQNGFEILRALRTRSTVPVILLTARGEDVDRSSASRSAPTTTCPSRSTRAS